MNETWTTVFIVAAAIAGTVLTTVSLIRFIDWASNTRYAKRFDAAYERWEQRSIEKQKEAEKKHMKAVVSTEYAVHRPKDID